MRSQPPSSGGTTSALASASTAGPGMPGPTSSRCWCRPPGPRSGSAGGLQARYNRLVRRFGGEKNPGAKKKAITAIAHTLLRSPTRSSRAGSPTPTWAQTSTPGGNHPSRNRPGWNASCKSSTRLHGHHHHQPPGGRINTRRLMTPQPWSRRQPASRSSRRTTDTLARTLPPLRSRFAHCRAPQRTQFSCQAHPAEHPSDAARFLWAVL